MLAITLDNATSLFGITCVKGALQLQEKKCICKFNDAYRNSNIAFSWFVIDGRNKIEVSRAAEVDKRVCLNPVFHVGLDVRSATSARRDPRQRTWQRAGERKAVGGQGQTDEPYLG